MSPVRSKSQKTNSPRTRHKLQLDQTTKSGLPSGTSKSSSNSPILENESGIGTGTSSTMNKESLELKLITEMKETGTSPRNSGQNQNGNHENQSEGNHSRVNTSFLFF